MNPRVGVFGKITVAGDFVAHNAGSAVARALQEWLVAEVEQLAGKRKHLPAVPVKFLFRDSSGTGACIGAFAPSRDRVGREFPLCAFSYVDVPVATHRYPSLPVAYEAFLESAAQVVAEAPAAMMDMNAVLARIDAIPMPGPTQLEDARTWTHQALEATGGQTILEALFGPLAQGGAMHGVHMFTTACAQVRGGDPGRAAIIADCPCTDDVQLVFWLRMAQELLAWQRAPPSLFWSGPGGPTSRLLVCLGAPPAGVLHYLADPTVAAEKLWPIRPSGGAVMDPMQMGLSAGRMRTLSQPPATAAGVLAGIVAG
jgi:type VI secretion system ImpM family protein